MEITKQLSKIRIITNAIESIGGITLLDVDPGPDTNRTVVTFVGSPTAVEEAAFLGIKTASEVIDMSKHKGTHPRIGATDVCPLIPVSNVSDKECIEIYEKICNNLPCPICKSHAVKYLKETIVPAIHLIKTVIE